MSALSPFKFLDAICDTKVDLLREGAEEKDYNAFLINRGLSYHIDTVLYAAEINSLGDLPVILQNDYYLNSVSKRKRFAKWSKQDAEQKDRETVIAVHLNISREKAREIYDLFTEEQISAMKEQQQK